VISGAYDKFSKGRCCLACTIQINKEFYANNREKYKQRSKENKLKKLHQNLIDENNIKILKP
jgi:gamma-glutamylcysteine synthetase